MLMFIVDLSHITEFSERKITRTPKDNQTPATPEERREGGVDFASTPGEYDPT